MIPSPSERTLRAAFVVCLGCVATYLLVAAFEPLRLNWGDPWSDSNAMTSGGHFSREGFGSLAFTPRVDIGPIGPNTLIYTHYPPLPDLVNGVLQRVTGGDHLALFRIVALVFTALALAFFHAFLQRLWGPAIAKVATAAMATNLLFLQYADTLHHIPLYTMTGFGALAAGVRWLDERRPWQLAAVAVATFFCFFASYDYYFFMPIMMLAAIRFRNHRWFGGPGLRLLLVFGLAGFASIVMKNLLAIWAIGLDAWHQDLVFQFLERSTSAYARVYKEGLSQVIFWRLYRFFSPLFYVCVVVQFVALIDWFRGRPVDISLQPIMLLVAAMPFVMVFSQLIVEQYHPTLLFLPFAAAALASVVVACWRHSRIVAAGLCAIYLGWQGFQLGLFHKKFLEPADVAGVRASLGADRHNFLMTNLLVDAPCRYYWNRYAIGILSDPLALRTQFETFGDDSPFTIVQLKHLAPYAYDKGIYMNFGGDRRWPWVSRPDYYRNSWARRFDEAERRTEKELAQIGEVVYESPALRVRQVTLAEIDRLQRSKVPRAAVREIDFEAAASEVFKLDGLSARQAADQDLPGFAWLEARVPTRMIFTLKGFGYLPSGPMVRTSNLLVPIHGAAHGKVVISTPVWIGQIITIAVNHHEVARRVLDPSQGAVDIRFDVPASVLGPDELQLVTFSYTATIDDQKGLPSGRRSPEHAAARLHSLVIDPEAPVAP